MKRLRAGMAEIVITPPVGVRLSGYRDRTSPSTGVLDELYAKAMVLDNGDTMIALVVCDVLGLGRSITTAIREAAQARTGIPAGNVMVTSIHTHCGPDIDLLGEASIEHLALQAAGAVWAAAGSLTEAGIGFGIGESLVGVNRRNPRAPRAYHLYSYPEGAMDPRVLTLGVRERSGRMLGAVVNYPCHPVTLGWNELNISKDYVEYTCGVLKSAWGARAVPIFLQGCAANVNPRWVYDKPDENPIRPPDWPEPLAERLRETRRLGHMLGGEALNAAESNTRYDEEPALGARLLEVTLPIRPDVTLAEVDESRPAGRYPALRERLARSTRELLTEVHVLRVGQSYIVGLPGEIFVEYQQELRAAIRSPFVFVSELAGDSIGYVPTPEAVKEGGYEPTAAYVTPEGGKMLVAAALNAVRQMVGGGA